MLSSRIGTKGVINRAQSWARLYALPRVGGPRRGDQNETDETVDYEERRWVSIKLEDDAADETDEGNR